ncbi:cathelicidin-related peptide Oh-Cath-like isoform X2 [Bufo bufo]|uniref:cathelicidin-related peptide Oh-Cath-like isoform X2 n=1 Tax=Bufo bufo TaxID=8384 RepID=UPI001ABECDF9|nr:cathelicidin-related peptide Oh-Cath-like isoform X2 [Bufo bufo]
MRSWWLSLLLVSAVTLQGCLSDTAEPEVQDGRSIGDIIDLYNQREGVTYLYKSLDQLPPVPLEEDENPERRAFTIKETVCLKAANPDLSQCDFKSDGDVQICSLVLGGENPEDIMCISLNKEVSVKRSSRRRPCRGRSCRPRLTGGNTVIGVRLTDKKQNRPNYMWV